MRHASLFRIQLAIVLLLPAAAVHAKQLGAERSTPANIEEQRTERLAQLVRMSVPPLSMRNDADAWAQQGMLVNEEFLAAGVEDAEARMKGISALRERALEIADAEAELARLESQGEAADSAVNANRRQRVYVLKTQIAQALQATKSRMNAIGAEHGVDMLGRKPGVSTWPQTGSKGP